MRVLLLAFTLATATTACSEKEKTDQAPAAGSAAGSAAAAAHDRTADDKATDDLQARGNAELEAAAAKAKLEAEATETRNQVGAEIQKDFDEADRRFIALKEKAAKATGATKQRADAAVADITRREATVMAGIAKLRGASGDAWTSTKAQLSADAAELGKAIDALGVTLQ